MKIKLQITIIIFFCSLFLSQAQIVFHTPNGTVVDANQQGETLTQLDIDSINAYCRAYIDTFQTIELIGDASSTYNCHGYAWNMTEPENGVACWMQSPEVYWLDASYVEVDYNYYINAPAGTTKIHYPYVAKKDSAGIYYSGDHSAVKTGEYDDYITDYMYISKWGHWSLMLHRPEDGPYSNMEERRYYVPAYRIIFKANGGAFTDNVYSFESYVGDTVRYRGVPQDGGFGGTIQSYNLPPAARDSFTFAGWATTANATIPDVSFSGSGYYVNEAKHNSILYAVWTPETPPVTPGSINPGTQTISSGDYVSLTHINSSNVTSRQWQKSTDNGYNWTSTGATGTSYSDTLYNWGASNIPVWYRVQVNGTNLYSSESHIIVTPPPDPEISGDDQICSGSSQYTLQDAPGGTIYWTSSDTSLLTVDSSGNPVMVNREGSGTGNVTLSARTGSISGTVVASKFVYVCALPATPVISGYSTICYGSSASFSATNWQSGYYWDKSNSLINISNPSSSSTSISVASSSSSGSVTVSVKNGSGVTLATYSVWVDAVPPALSSVYSESGNWCTAGTSTLWTAYSNTTGANVVWGVSGYNSSYEQVFADIESKWSDPYGYEYATIYFDEPGDYTIYVYTENSCGNSTPAYKSNFSVYAFRMGFNPETDEIEIRIDDGQAGRSIASNSQFTVTVSDSSGAARTQGNYSGNEFSVPVSSLADGTYTVKISNGTISDTQQLVIKR